MNAGWAVFLVLITLLVAGGIGYVVFSRIRAQRLGVSPSFPPSPCLSVSGLACLWPGSSIGRVPWHPRFISVARVTNACPCAALVLFQAL